MKKILMIGDSISGGYVPYIKEALEGVAEVYHPETCRFAQYTLRQLHEWKNQFKLDDCDIVHWNVGLWDTVILFGEELLTPPDVYGMFMERICKRLKLLFPNAKIIFATSTPVLEKRYGKDFRRKNSDIIEFNRIAVEIVKKYSMEINDLHAAVKDVPENYFSDATHMYTQEATEILVDKILRCLAPYVGVDVDKMAYVPKFTPPAWFLGK